MANKTHITTTTNLKYLFIVFINIFVSVKLQAFNIYSEAVNILNV